MTRAALSLCLALALTLLAATPAVAQTGQINGVVTDNTGGVVPGALIKARRSGHRPRARDGIGCGRPLYLHLAPADDLRHLRRVERLPPGAAQGRPAAGQPEPHHELLGRARHPGRNRYRVRRIAARGRLVGHAQRSRRFQAHRRAPAQRPRRRHAQHAGARHGVDDGRSRVGKDDSRRAAHVDQRHRVAAGLVSARRHQPLRPVLPAESAVPVPRRAPGVQHPDEQLQRRPGQQRRRRRQRGHAIGDQRPPRRRVRLPARS